jgi:hypothetical protein
MKTLLQVEVVGYIMNQLQVLKIERIICKEYGTEMTDLSYNQVIKNGEGANNLKLYKGTNSYN